MSEKENDPLPQVSEKTLQDALLRVIHKAPSLIKASKNTHGGYQYAGIDEFYKEIVPVANAEGIHWHATETHNSILTVGAKNSLIAKLTYSFTISFRDTVIPDYFVCTIFHPLIGAQTAGSALSYADKLFQRHVFKVQTGEEDADSQPNSVDNSIDVLADMGPPIVKPSRSTPPTEQLDISGTIAMVTEFCKSCKDVKELSKYWDDNVGVIDVVKASDRKGYMEILNAFKTRKTQLTEA